MYDTTRLLLLLGLVCALLACLLPSLGHCYILLDEEDVGADDVDGEDGEWKRGYAGNVVADPVARSPMTYKSMSRYLQNLASRRLVNDQDMAKRQVHVGLRLATFDALRNHLENVAASRHRQQFQQNEALMSRVGRR